MIDSTELVKTWRLMGAIYGYEINAYGVSSDLKVKPMTARNIYKAANSAWRLSVSDDKRIGSAPETMADTWISALIMLNAKVALKAQPDYVGQYTPWVRDRAVHHTAGEILWKMKAKMLANVT